MTETIKPYGDPPARRKWSRKRKVVVAAVALMLAATAAFGVLLPRLNIQGGGNVRTPAGVRFLQVELVSFTGFAAGGTPPTAVMQPGGTSATINMNDALPGATMDVQFVVQRTGDQPGSTTVADFRFSDITDEVFTGGGVGSVIPSSPDFLISVVRITVPASSLFTGTFTAQVDAGYYADFAQAA